MGVFVGGPGVGFDGAEEGDGLARLEGVEMSAGFAGGVFFDQELDVAGVVCVVSFFFFFPFRIGWCKHTEVTDRSVGPNNWKPTALRTGDSK